MKLTSNKEIHRGRIEKVQSETSSTIQRLDEINEKFQKRKVNSPCYIDSLLRKSDDLKEEVERLEMRLGVLKRQHSIIEKAEEDQRRLVSGFEKEMDTQTQIVRASDLRLSGLEANIESLNKSINEKEAQISMAKKIRNMKLHSITLKRD